MRKELNPAIVWVLVVIVVVVVAVIGYKVLAPRGFKEETTGSEKSIENVKKGGTFYTPPAGAPVPGAGGAPMTPGGGK